MPFRTKIQYFDVENGEEITNDRKKRLQQIIKEKYVIIKKTTRHEYDRYTGWTTIHITAECERTRQRTLF